ncbi:MAG TPA: hypothetical protein VNT57_00830 [Desulfobacteria bacterium]|nr:hypothetical protein [Desulfobacteria bacterium]
MTEILVIMNNYFHDVATALLVSSALVMLSVAKLLPEQGNAETMKFFLAVYRRVTTLARVSLLWILLGGIPRVIYYKKIEWTIALDNDIIPALMIKHIIMFLFVLAGVAFWVRLARKVKELEASLQKK